MTDKPFFYLKLGILLFVGVLVFSSLLEFKSPSAIELITIKTDRGWGYKILVNGKTYIQQQHIPAVNGFQAFNTTYDAEKTGMLVIGKLKKGEIPTVQISELDSLKIKFTH